MGKFKRDADRCSVEWNPDEWPFATRCNQSVFHMGANHCDHRGRTYNTRTNSKTNPPRKKATDDSE